MINYNITLKRGKMRKLNKKLNKRGAEMAIGTLVVIVLAIIVLVVIALGFGTGWSNLWNKMTGYFSPVNVDTVKQACSYACTSGASYDYCCLVRDVKYTTDSQEKVTCNLGQKSGKLGIDVCNEIGCDSSENANICSSVKCNGLAKLKCDTVTENTVKAKTLDISGQPILKGQVCCESKSTKKCTGTANACADLASQPLLCDSQKTILGTNIKPCKYTPATGNNQAKCEEETGYSVIQCDKLILSGTDDQKRNQCLAQSICNWE